MANTKPKIPVEWVQLDALLAAERNPKLHDIETVAASIREHGYVDHGVLDRRTGRMVGGHGRAGALRWLRGRGELPEHWDTVQPNVWVDAKGDWWVPTSITTTRDADDADNLLLALNSGDRPGWDRGGLAAMLDQLRQTPTGLIGTGYDDTAVDDLLASISSTGLPEGGTDPALSYGTEFRVLVVCADEAVQVALAEELEHRGLTVQLQMS